MENSTNFYFFLNPFLINLFQKNKREHQKDLGYDNLGYKDKGSSVKIIIAIAIAGQEQTNTKIQFTGLFLTNILIFYPLRKRLTKII